MTTDTNPADGPDDTPALDAQAIARLRELDPTGQFGVVPRVMATFDASLRRLLAQLESERGGGNAAAVSAIAHTLKSSSASVGALSLAAACAEIEGRLRGGDASRLAEDIERLLAQGQGALRAVSALLPR